MSAKDEPKASQAKDGPDLVQEVTREWASLQRRLREDLELHLSAQDRLLRHLLQSQRQESPRRRRPSPPGAPSRPAGLPDRDPTWAQEQRPVSSWRAQEPGELVEAEAAAWLDETFEAADLALDNTPIRLYPYAPSEKKKEEQPEKKQEDKKVPSEKKQAQLTHTQLRQLAKRGRGEESGGMAENLQLQLEAHVNDFKNGQHKSVSDMSAKDFKLRLMSGFFASIDWWLSLEEPPRTSRLARLVRSNVFEFLSFVMVMTNCAFIVQSKNWSMQNLGKAYPADILDMEVFYTSYFLLELLLRLAVSRWYFFANHDMGWNMLDAAINLLSVYSTVSNIWGESMQLTFLRTVRVLKLARVLRMLRMVRFFSAVRVMIVAILDSMLSLFWCCVLLLFLLLVFALLFVQFVEDFMVAKECTMPDCRYDEIMQNFGSVQAAMLSLYMSITGGNDWSYYYLILDGTGGTAGALFVFFTVFYLFGVFNVISGIFVDKALRAAQPDMDLMLVDMRHKEKDFIQGFEHVLRQFDVNSDGVIQTKEFKQLVESHGGRMYLRMLGIEPKHTEVVFNGLQSINDHVSVADFVRGVMRMKGTANNLDVHAMHYEVSHVAKAQKGMMAALASIKEDIASMKHRA